MKFKSILLGIMLLFSPVIVSPVFAQTVPALNSSGGTDLSFNWSGYVSVGGNFSSITSSWNVPHVTSSTGFAGDATWIGIGGMTGTDLIQIGTQAVSSASGQIQYQAFYEMLPQSSQYISMAINPGDSVTATLAEQSVNLWALSFRDNTTGQSFQTTVAYRSSLSSAEWVEEMPSTSNNAFIPLDNFGTIAFNNASAVKNGSAVSIAGAGSQAMDMLNGSNQPLAVASSLFASGEGFTVTRTAAIPSASSAQGQSFSQRGRRTGVGIRGYAPSSRASRINSISVRRFGFMR